MNLHVTWPSSFDINKDGFISFAEFVQILSVLTRGTPEQKLECMILPLYSTCKLMPECSGFPHVRYWWEWQDNKGKASAICWELYKTRRTTRNVHRCVILFSGVDGAHAFYSGRKYDSPEQFVSEFFEQTDTNEDGLITLDEYKEGAMKNPDVISGLRLYDSK